MPADLTSSSTPGAITSPTPALSRASEGLSEPQRYLSIEEAATYLNVSVRFLRRLVDERRVRHYKVGKFVRFHPSDLDEFVDVKEPLATRGADPALVTEVWRHSRRLT